MSEIDRTSLELMPLTRLDSKLIGTGKPSQLTRELLIVYGKIVD